VRGLPANHVLLFGERGTGKSSAVRGLVARFGSRGLRVVKVRKQDLLHLPRVLEALRGAPWRFLLFCDDLSFDAGETRYRELKAALEGSLLSPPANVRIIATSNRRHLLPESAADNLAARLDEAGDLHMGEVVDEKLALSDRFGLVLGFYGFDQATYLSIVDRYATQAGIRAPREALHEQALRFALERSSRSGRTARHFIDEFAGRKPSATRLGDRPQRVLAEACWQVSLQPRASSRCVTSGSARTSSRPGAGTIAPSQSLPIAVASSPPTSRRWSASASSASRPPGPRNSRPTASPITPPRSATARICASRLRGGRTERQALWLTTKGRRIAPRASSTPRAFTCARSTTMPSDSISATSSKPKGVRPRSAWEGSVIG
jgi:predicted AAA+ superfamily ATPase